MQIVKHYEQNDLQNRFTLPTQPFFLFQLSILVKDFSKSKNMKKLLAIFIALLLGTSCDKEASLSDCLEEILADLNMVPSREPDSVVYLEQYTFQGQQYFIISDRVSNISLRVFDCDNNTLCGGISQDCDEFFTNATYNGVVGVTP